MAAIQRLAQTGEKEGMGRKEREGGTAVKCEVLTATDVRAHTAAAL